MHSFINLLVDYCTRGSLPRIVPLLKDEFDDVSQFKYGVWVALVPMDMQHHIDNVQLMITIVRVLEVGRVLFNELGSI